MLDDLDDRRLAELAGGGDDLAFAALVGRHRDALVRAVARRTGRPELAEDAVQEALAAAHGALRDGRVPADPRAWLATIAWRRAIDLRRRERDAVPLDTVTAAHAAAGPEAAALHAARVDTVLTTWKGLPARQRSALVLSVLEGRSLQEIAAALDLEPAAAKSLVARGRRGLLRQLELAELPCTVARAAIATAVRRGVRLGGDVSLHVGACGSCAQAHRRLRLRARARAVVLVPLGAVSLVDQRLRDLLASAAAHEAPLGTTAKLCAVACAGVVAGGPVAGVTPSATPAADAVRRAAERPASQPGGARSSIPVTALVAAPGSTRTRSPEEALGARRPRG